MNIKFMYNGIKVDGKLYKVSYHGGPYHTLPEGTITITAKSLVEGLPYIPGFAIQNETDSQTDYFEKDRVRVMLSSPHYAAVKAALDKCEQRHEERIQRRKAA